MTMVSNLHSADAQQVELALRSQMLAAARRLSELGLNRGSTGNVSARHGDTWLVTPSGVPPEELAADAMVAMDFTGKVSGAGKPSSEWRSSRDVR